LGRRRLGAALDGQPDEHDEHARTKRFHRFPPLPDLCGSGLRLLARGIAIPR